MFRLIVEILGDLPVAVTGLILAESLRFLFARKGAHVVDVENAGDDLHEWAVEMETDGADVAGRHELFMPDGERLAFLARPPGSEADLEALPVDRVLSTTDEPTIAPSTESCPRVRKTKRVYVSPRTSTIRVEADNPGVTSQVFKRALVGLFRSYDEVTFIRYRKPSADWLLGFRTADGATRAVRASRGHQLSMILRSQHLQVRAWFHPQLADQPSRPRNRTQTVEVCDAPANLPIEVVREAMMNLFSKFGPVTDMQHNAGTWCIHFLDLEGASRAINASKNRALQLVLPRRTSIITAYPKRLAFEGQEPSASDPSSASGVSGLPPSSGQPDAPAMRVRSYQRFIPSGPPLTSTQTFAPSSGAFASAELDADSPSMFEPSHYSFRTSSPSGISASMLGSSNIFADDIFSSTAPLVPMTGEDDSIQMFPPM